MEELFVGDGEVKVEGDVIDLETRLSVIQALIPLGLEAVADLLQQEVEQLAGVRYARKGSEQAHRRWGSQKGSVYLMDQKLPLDVPRVRDVEADAEVSLAAYRALQTPKKTDEGLLLRVLKGISCRNYKACAESVPEAFGSPGARRRGRRRGFPGCIPGSTDAQEDGRGAVASCSQGDLVPQLQGLCRIGSRSVWYLSVLRLAAVHQSHREEAEAATDVEEARSSLAAAEEEMTKAEKALSEANEEIDRCRSERARLEGELTIQRKAVETEDHEGAKSLTDECAGRLDSLPEPENEEVDDALRVKMEETAARASRKTQELENELQRVEGALEQIGGSYIEEQVNQSQEAIEAVRQQELDLELEFGAWQLLRETLAEAEQQDSVHLGNALVEPVSARMSTLTGGRYGDIAIGPQMDATGIHLAGSERQFDSLSVGTQEQVALMLRLSIAEALGTFLILDDQATQSDPQRMEWIRDVLERAAEEIQVVVMTCHQEDYVGEGLPVDSHVVDLADCVERTP